MKSPRALSWASCLLLAACFARAVEPTVTASGRSLILAVLSDEPDGRHMVLFPEVESVLDRPKGKPVDLESLFLAFVVDYSAKLIPDEQLRHGLMIALKKEKVLEQAQRLLEASNNPVLAFHPSRVVVCPDFMVGQMLADIPKGDQFPFIQIPLLPPLAAAHKAMGLAAPPIPQKTPAKLIHYYREDDGSFALYEFVNMGQGRHEIRLTPLETRPVGERS